MFATLAARWWKPATATTTTDGTQHAARFTRNQPVQNDAKEKTTMFRNTLARSIAAIGSTAALALGASPAMADSRGAVIVNLRYCQNFGYATVCDRTQVENGFATTPSGATIIEFNAKFDYTVTYADGSIDTGTGYGHGQYLFQQDQPQEFSNHNSATFTSSVNGTCTFGYDLHYANGQYQFDNSTFACP